MLNALKIDACSISDSAAEALNRALNSRSLPRLQHVAIGGNRLGPMGLAAMAYAFSKCASLKSLDLSCTPMSASPAVVPADADLPELLAWLDHERPPRRIARGADGERRLMRSGTNVSEGSAAGTAVASEDGGIDKAGRGSPGTLLFWSKDTAQAIVPLLQIAENIKAQKCLWDNDALKVLFNAVSSNATARTVGIHFLRSGEKQDNSGGPAGPPPLRQVTIAQALQKLQARAASGSAADLVSISFSGFLAGDLERALKGKATSALGSKLKSCVLRCPNNATTDVRHSMQPHAPVPIPGPTQVCFSIPLLSKGWYLCGLHLHWQGLYKF
jgi:hypothetical protein